MAVRASWWVFLALVVTVAGCVPRHEGGGASAVPDPAHNSRNSLDWAGVYEGVLPCADCPGIRTRLTLRQDGTYEVSRLYIDRDREPRLASGRFAWQPGDNAIALEAQHGGQRFAVGEGRLALLEPGAAPRWPQPARYELQRVAAAPDADLPRTLESHRWTLASAIDAQGRRIEALLPGAGRPVVFSFAEGRLNIEGGCNRLFGGYRVEGGRLALGRQASTMMACEPALMKVDSTLADLLAQPAKIEATPGAEPALRLITADGGLLAFTGRLTHESRYGAPTRVFLEVAAQTVPCPNPPAGASACLQVRERRYDEKGLVVGTPGPWQTFAEPIEGYTHEAGVRNVLRLKRFDRGTAGGVPPYLYVLDLVVESEKVSR